MACVSGISLLKLAVLAAILPRPDFASYAMVFAAVAFASEAISFGLTQATVKKYPRLVAYNRAGEILTDLHVLATKLSLRYALIYVPLAVAAWFYASTEGLVALTGVSLVAIGTNLFGVIASICRAVDRLVSLAVFGLLRASLATIAALGLALNAGWEKILLGEGIVIVGVGLATMHYLRGVVREEDHRTRDTRTNDDMTRFISAPRDGLITFISFLLLTLPSSFDRLFVGTLSDLDVAASYAFVGIWVTASITLVGIYTQKLGPDIVRLRATGQMNAPLAFVMPRALLLAGVLFFGTLVSFFFLYVFMHDTLWTKYETEWINVLAVSLLVGLMVSAIFDWTLLALDGEQSLMVGGILLVSGYAVLFFVADQLGYGLTGFLGAAIGARSIHLLWQIFSISKLQSGLSAEKFVDPDP